jgi:hypothetical protein
MLPGIVIDDDDGKFHLSDQLSAISGQPELKLMADC